MAIDYKKEWEKLLNKHGHRKIENDIGITQRLGSLMYAQIDRTIEKREKLMKEYIKETMRTDIAQGYRTSYDVKVFYDDRWFGTVNISKSNFNAWCKKRENKMNVAEGIRDSVKIAKTLV